MKNNENYINGDWYETIPVVENYDNLKIKNNILDKYVPIIFSWNIGDPIREYKKFDPIIFSQRNNNSELLSDAIPKKIVGIVDFNKFIHIIKDELGYDMFMKCGNEKCEISNFYDYLEQIINSSYSLKYVSLFLNADFNKKNNEPIYKICKRKKY